MSQGNYSNFIIRGAALALSGFVLSGPVAVMLVTLIKPQPVWISSSVFVENYHVIQNLPYYLGFLLLGGMLILAAGHYLQYHEERPVVKLKLVLALSLTIVFCGLIAFNYICQTTFIHNLATHYRPEYGPLIAGFSMANPTSFCWANEMWGYGVLGVATWLTAAYYKEKNSFIYWLLILNGIVSLISPLWTIIDVNWVMSPLGFSLYLFWNVLMIVLMITIIRYTSSLSV
jgi:hypothetical protein